MSRRECVLFSLGVILLLLGCINARNLGEKADVVVVEPNNVVKFNEAIESRCPTCGRKWIGGTL